MDELALLGERKQRDLIIIDDYPLMGKVLNLKAVDRYKAFTSDWRNITHHKVRKAYNRPSDELLLGDLLILYPKK